MKSRTPNSYSMEFGYPYFASPPCELQLSFSTFLLKKKGVKVENYCKTSGGAREQQGAQKEELNNRRVPVNIQPSPMNECKCISRINKESRNKALKTVS
jgi:hypothetical protein